MKKLVISNLPHLTLTARLLSDFIDRAPGVRELSRAEIKKVATIVYRQLSAFADHPEDFDLSESSPTPYPWTVPVCISDTDPQSDSQFFTAHTEFIVTERELIITAITLKPHDPYSIE